MCAYVIECFEVRAWGYVCVCEYVCVHSHQDIWRHLCLILCIFNEAQRSDHHMWKPLNYWRQFIFIHSHEQTDFCEEKIKLIHQHTVSTQRLFKRYHFMEIFWKSWGQHFNKHFFLPLLSLIGMHNSWFLPIFAVKWSKCGSYSTEDFLIFSLHFCYFYYGS